MRAANVHHGFPTLDVPSLKAGSPTETVSTVIRYRVLDAAVHLVYLGPLVQFHRINMLSYWGAAVSSSESHVHPAQLFLCVCMFALFS